MLTTDESELVRAYIKQLWPRDVSRVLLVNFFAIIFTATTNIKAPWFYFSWFLLSAFVVASFGYSISSVTVPKLPVCERIPDSISTPLRGSCLICLQGFIVSVTRFCI
jgi:hypothetical protein